MWPPSPSPTSTTSKSFSPSMSTCPLTRQCARVPLTLSIDTSRPIDSHPRFRPNTPFPLPSPASLPPRGRRRRRLTVLRAFGRRHWSTKANVLSSTRRQTAIERASGRCWGTTVTSTILRKKRKMLRNLAKVKEVVIGLILSGKFVKFHHNFFRGSIFINPGDRGANVEKRSG